MNILITGANGYLARSLIKELKIKKLHNLTMLVRKSSNINELLKYCDREKIIFYDNTIKSLENIKDHNIDLVFHLANYYPDSSRPEIPQDIIDSNFTLIVNVLAKLKLKKDIKIINVTTYLDDTSLYSLSKNAAKRYINNFNCNTIELSDTYGIKDLRPKLINLLINYSESGKKLLMKSSPDSEINLTYIKDIVRGFISSIEFASDEKKWNRGKVFAIKNQSITLKDVIDTFNEVSSKKVIVEWLNEKFETGYHADSMVKTLPDWKPIYNLTMGLTEILKK